MLTTAEIAEHLERITYRPGWSFCVYDGRFEGQHLTIHAVLEDAFNPGQNIELGIECFLPPLEDEAALNQWLVWRLARIEVHECREFLKCDGKVLFPPHAPYADRDLK